MQYHSVSCSTLHVHLQTPEQAQREYVSLFTIGTHPHPAYGVRTNDRQWANTILLFIILIDWSDSLMLPGNEATIWDQIKSQLKSLLLAKNCYSYIHAVCSNSYKRADSNSSLGQFLTLNHGENWYPSEFCTTIKPCSKHINRQLKSSHVSACLDERKKYPIHKW